MDWNWFFSAVAQSAAAIVAIFGGFIATQIISNRIEFQRKREGIRECIRTGLKIISEGEAAGFSFLIANSRQGGLHSIEMKIYKDVPVKDAVTYYLEADFSIFDNREEIEKEINKLIDNFKNNPKNPLTRIGVLGSESSATRHYNNKQNAEESINKFIINANKQSALSNELSTEATANPYSTPIVTIAISGIVMLFYIGVIYPLSFMPIIGEPSLSLSAFWDILFSLRGAILLAISTIFTLIMLAFLVINIKLKFDDNELKELLVYSKPCNYSPFLETAEINSVYLSENA